MSNGWIWENKGQALKIESRKVRQTFQNYPFNYLFFSVSFLKSYLHLSFRFKSQNIFIKIQFQQVNSNNQSDPLQFDSNHQTLSWQFKISRRPDVSQWTNLISCLRKKKISGFSGRLNFPLLLFFHIECKKYSKTTVSDCQKIKQCGTRSVIGWVTA